MDGIPNQDATPKQPVKMRVTKGLAVVIFANLVVSLSSLYLFMQFPGMEAYVNSFIFLILPITLGFGALSWTIRAILSHVISKHGFKSNGQLKDLLYSYGIAHITLLLSAIGIFMLFLGNMGLFMAIFLGMFSSLLLALLLVRALARSHSMDWTRSLIVIIIVEVMMFGLSFFLIPIVPGLASPINSITQSVTLS